MNIQYDTVCENFCLILFFFAAQILSTDYEIGHFLRSRLIPKAVLYYTGDIVDEDDDDDYDEEEEEEEDSDEDDDDDDDAPVPARKIGGLKGGTKENPAECKQQ